jgi:hypothetical protein
MLHILVRLHDVPSSDKKFNLPERYEILNSYATNNITVTTCTQQKLTEL